MSGSARWAKQAAGKVFSLGGRSFKVRRKALALNGLQHLKKESAKLAEFSFCTPSAPSTYPFKFIGSHRKFSTSMMSLLNASSWVYRIVPLSEDTASPGAWVAGRFSRSNTRVVRRVVTSR
jgi:hypothetical protein